MEGVTEHGWGDGGFQVQPREDSPKGSGQSRPENDGGLCKHCTYYPCLFGL